uniref:Inositol-tetrakisphosphate 1-kinase n=1 Tax=Chlamydomonas leiostraca TaxID=1034604 RepID=A0A7S0RNW4_9CHLO|mmetsp:Transcript_27760/g.70769  ORF Transcript_27760/g.70769 Transcript_27760/m.70769 type:complete len:431 (+) Transcript_27760:115-1407(+)
MDDNYDHERNGQVHENAASTSAPSDRRHLRVGCALLPKKVSRYLTPAMIETAAAQGIELCLIDYRRPLQEQGLFDGIVHKLRPNKEWESNLLEYTRQHPEVTVIDHVDGIKTLQNRSTMLFPLQGEGIVVKPTNGRGGDGAGCARVQAPVQVEIGEGTTLEEAQQLLRQAGLTTPLLVKPLWSDGREGSHGLAVLHDLSVLGKLLSGHISSDLKPPLVVQQFVEHGGVLFKVYVLGARTVVSKRPSLGNSYLGIEARRKGVLQLPRISCKSVYSQSAPDLLQLPQSPGAGGAESMAAAVAAAARAHAEQEDDHPGHCLPPDWVTHALAGALRRRLGLQLFNFDLICPEEQGHPQERLYYVIDINYFPGVDKIPDFERVFVEFLRAACTGSGGVNGAAQPPQQAQPQAQAQQPAQQQQHTGGVKEAVAAPA